MAGNSWENMLAALQTTWERAPGFGTLRPSPEQRAENRAAVREFFTRPSPEQRAENRAAVSALVPSVMSSSPATALGAGVVASMLASGGEAPPARTAAAVSPEVLAQAPPGANLAGPAATLSPLGRILGNLAKDDPKGQITLGALRKLAAVYPSTPAGSNKLPSAKDVAGANLMEIADKDFQNAYALSQKSGAGEEALRIAQAAKKRRDDLYLQLATSTKSNEEALADLLKPEKPVD